jgi:GntR family transcriptional regulator/MocR family aminotransferase
MQLGAPDSLTQLAFAHFLSSGVLDQHIRQVRSICRARHSVLRDAVAEHLPNARMTSVPAGTHAYIRLPAGVDDLRLAAIARRRSVLVHSGRHFQLGRQPSAPGLVLGYDAVQRGLLPGVVGVLAAAMDQVTGLLAS